MTERRGNVAAARAARLVRLLRFAAVLAPLACAGPRVPDPRDAARAYAAAAAHADATALYALLAPAAQQSLGRERVGALVREEREELVDQAAALTRPDVRVTASALLRFADGEEAALELADGRYRVTAAGSLPGGARTPQEALEQLRRVLARRSYSGLLRVLSPATRNAVENDVRSLVDGLDEPAALPVRLSGDAAVVPVPGGHEVRLKREGGLWRVDDFD